MTKFTHTTRGIMTNEQLREQYKERAQAERDAGGSCKVDLGIPWIDVVMSNGDEYYFAEHEADALLDEVPGWINAEDFIQPETEKQCQRVGRPDVLLFFFEPLGPDLANLSDREKAISR